MVYRKRRTTRPRRFKKVYRKPMAKGGRIRQPVQYFTRTTYSQGVFVIPPATGPAGGSLFFSLNQLLNPTDFTNLYDQYQIKAVKVSLIPRYTEASAVNSQNIGNFHSVLDYDDAAPPAALLPLLQYQNLKRTRTNQIHTRYLKPALANEVFNSGITTGYGPKKNVWLDCNSDSVEHYGMKWFCDGSVAGVTYDLSVKYYLAFKNVR